MPARPDILAALTEAGIERIVVHTRDPRQSMISGIHHHAGMFANGSFEATVFVTRLPRDYTQWLFAEQADHYLAHRFEQEVRWVADWRKTVREGQFPGRVLLTNYETFRQDNQAYFEALLALYDIPFEMFDWGQIEAAPEKGTLHYRSGETMNGNAFSPRHRYRVPIRSWPRRALMRTVSRARCEFSRGYSFDSFLKS